MSATRSWSWSEAATETSVRALYEAVGETLPPRLDEGVALLGRVLARVGGLPVSKQQPDLQVLGSELLAAACRRALVLGGTARPPHPGVVLLDTPLPLTQEAHAVEAVDVNAVTDATLAALPVLGPALAKRVVEERRLAGAFASLEDLARRVDGIGPQMVRRLAGCLSFAPATGPAPVDLTGSAGALFARLARLWRNPLAPQNDAVLATLDRLLTLCAGKPHPDSVARRARPSRDEALDRLQWKSAMWAGVLSGDAYALAVARLLKDATQTVDLCMFHIALGVETKALVEALIDAAARGVVVRVLVDRDRRDDPYRSTLINSRARKALEAGGVKVRQDPANVLLHSKFMVVDSALVVLGSHNWSAGSLSGYDDTSVVLQSSDLAAVLTLRFDALWR